MAKLSKEYKIEHHKSFEGEFLSLLKGCGNSKRIKNLFDRKLNILIQAGKECTRTKTFERLKTAQSLYCLRIKDKEKNIRLIFIFNDIHNKVIFLVAFEERKDADYYNAIELAKARKKGG